MLGRESMTWDIVRLVRLFDFKKKERPLDQTCCPLRHFFYHLRWTGNRGWVFFLIKKLKFRFFFLVKFNDGRIRNWLCLFLHGIIFYFWKKRNRIQNKSMELDERQRQENVKKRVVVFVGHKRWLSSYFPWRLHPLCR